jgi:hypothetical protein
VVDKTRRKGLDLGLLLMEGETVISSHERKYEKDAG